jgi:hypothetical protein
MLNDYIDFLITSSLSVCSFQNATTGFFFMKGKQISSTVIQLTCSKRKIKQLAAGRVCATVLKSLSLLYICLVEPAGHIYLAV